MKRIKKNISPKPAFAFVVEGETEKWYLQMLKKNEDRISVNIEPRISQKKKLEDQYNLVYKLAKSEYTKVYWIIDLDAILNESEKVQTGKETQLDKLKKHIKKLKKDVGDVAEVIINNPCFEIWFLLHYINTTKNFNSCSNVENDLKEYISNYAKSEKFLKKDDDDIYLKLKPNLKTAIKKSQILGIFDESNPYKTISEMGFIFNTNEFSDIFNS